MRKIKMDEKQFDEMREWFKDLNKEMREVKILLHRMLEKLQ